MCIRDRARSADGESLTARNPHRPIMPVGHGLIAGGTKQHVGCGRPSASLLKRPLCLAALLPPPSLLSSEATNPADVGNPPSAFKGGQHADANRLKGLVGKFGEVQDVVAQQLQVPEPVIEAGHVRSLSFGPGQSWSDRT
eukprot:3796206-Alexandrium_andersonii.AAC.1